MMPAQTPRLSDSLACVLLLGALAGSGCTTGPPTTAAVPGAGAYIPADMPRELHKATLPAHRVEPPDILTIDALHVVPRPPYHLRTLDSLTIQLQRSPTDRLRELDQLEIQVPGALLDAPINGVYAIQGNGFINLGIPYGSVKVAGLSLQEVRQAIEKHLAATLADPATTVFLAGTGIPIDGIYPIQVGGVVDLGMPYGSVRVTGLTVQQAQEAIREHLSRFLDDPRVTASLAQIAAQQQIMGEHLVNPDGTVNLGTYGSVRVVGLTLPEVKMVIEHHLSQFLEDPEVAVNIYAYNSKVYYIITQGAGLGDRVLRFPVTGNETVLDAIAQISGLEQISSKDIWIARPTHDPETCQLLPINWDKITAQARAETNYQLLPGDRIFIAEDRWYALDTWMAKVFGPFERLAGFTTLGVSTVGRLSGDILFNASQRGIRTF